MFQNIWKMSIFAISIPFFCVVLYTGQAKAEVLQVLNNSSKLAYRNSVVKAADRLIQLQNSNGSWDWDVSGQTGPTGNTYLNTSGVTAEGLLSAYTLTGEPKYLDAAKKTGDYIISTIGELSASKRINAFNIRFLDNLARLTPDAKYSVAADSYVEHMFNMENSLCGVACDGGKLVLSQSNLRGAPVSSPDGIVPWDLAPFVEVLKSRNSTLATEVAQQIAFYVSSSNFTSSTGNYYLGVAAAVRAMSVAGVNKDEFDNFITTLSEQQDEITALLEPVQVSAYVLLGLKSAGEDVSHYANFLQEKGNNGVWLDNAAEYSELDGEVAYALATIFSPGEFFTIGDAVRSASDGDVINVTTGTFNEDQIVINKPVSLVGAGVNNSIINGNLNLDLSLSGLVNITSPGNVTLSGFTIRNSGYQTCKGASKCRFGVYVSSNDTNSLYTISNNKIEGTNDPNEDEDYGIYASNGKEHLIFDNNIVTKTGANAILVEKHEGPITISNNTLDVGVYGSDAIFVMTYGGLNVSSLQEVTGNTIDVGTGDIKDAAHRAAAVTFASAFTGTEGKFTNIKIGNNTVNNLQPNRRGIGLWNNAPNAETAELGNITNAEITGNILNGLGADASGSFGIRLLGLVTKTVVDKNIFNPETFGFVEVAWNGHGPASTIIPAHYQFTLPNLTNVVATIEQTDIPFSISPLSGNTGYSNARINVSVLDKPAGSTIDFKGYVLEDNSWYDVLQLGWGPIEGMEIPANFSRTDKFNLKFSDPGVYTIQYTLVDNDSQVDSGTFDVTVLPYTSMAINYTVPEFIVGREANFTVSTIGNDDAGKIVRAHFTIPEGVHLFYQEQDGNYYPLKDFYGPLTGFSVGDVTSNFKAKFDTAGTYSSRVDFKQLDGTIIASKNIEVTAYDSFIPTFSADNYSFVSGKEQRVGVTTRNSGNYSVSWDDTQYVITLVNGKDAISSLKYLEIQGQNAGKWLNLPYSVSGDDLVAVFGPSTGFTFPAGFDLTSQFKVTFTNGKSGTFTMNIVMRSGGTPVAEGNLTFNVVYNIPQLNLLPFGKTFYKGGDQLSISWTSTYPENLIGSNPITITFFPNISDQNVQIVGSGSANGSTFLTIPSNVNSETAQIKITAIDAAGKAILNQSEFFTIDNLAPEISIDPYSTEPTNKDIAVTAQSDGTLNVTSHTFDSNDEFDFIATDQAGNQTTKTVTITNIDKDAPIITIQPYIETPTNQQIIVHATTNEGTLNFESHTFLDNYPFTFIATDSAGNVSSQQVMINNIDLLAPIIEQSDSIVAEAVGPLGAEVDIVPPVSHDIFDGTLPSICDRSTGIFPLGATIVACNKTDIAGNQAIPVTFTVTVQDSTAPTITLTGPTVPVAFGGNYSELGATAVDVVDGQIPVVISGSVNSLISGLYQISYSASDEAGNVSTPVVRSVQVLPRDISLLSSTITSAQNKIAAANEGINVGNYLSGSKVTFESAINSALSVKDDVIATQAEIDAAYSTLSAAEAAFEAKKIVTQPLSDYTEITNLNPTVTIPENNGTSEINVPLGVTNAELDLSGLMSKEGDRTSASLSGGITVNASTSIGNVTVNIPEDITIWGSSSWDGEINLPQVQQNSAITSIVPDPGRTASVSSVIEIGYGSILTFDKAVKIILRGQAGKYVGYSRDGAFTQIKTVCSANSQEVGDALPEGGDCYIDVGADLIIWTKHFTSFVTYTQTTNPVNNGNGGGGGGGGGTIMVPPLQAPAGGFRINILNVVSVDEKYEVTLALNGGNASRMSISNSEDFSSGATQELYQPTKLWSVTDSVKKIYVKFYDANGNASPPVFTVLNASNIKAKPQTKGLVLGEKISRFDDLLARLKLGNRGSEVKELQKKLKALGYFSASFKPTEYYGALTDAAVKKYLAKMKLVDLPVEDNKLLDSLVSRLKFGQYNNLVKQLQNELKKEGFYPRGLSATGYYGATTKASVEKYLKAKKS